MSEELVTIKTFFYDHETLFYEPLLKSAGIDYLLKDQKTVAIDPLISNAIGGIKLQVKRSDVQRAAAVINEIERNRSIVESEHEINVDGKKFRKILEECPKCSSEETYMQRVPVLKLILYTFIKRTHYCTACKHQWKQF